jgi:conjugative transfer signal peptidase TraF
MTRWSYLTSTALAVTAIGLVSIMRMMPVLMWNASASVPVGLYAVRPFRRATPGELVTAAPPKALAGLFDRRGYLPRGVPLMKHIAAVPGQTVCRRGDTITIDGTTIGTALMRDSHRRPLPVWQGCRRLTDSQVFLMNARVHDSLDGRYFGPLPQNSIIGRAIPILTDEDGDGRYEWRALADQHARLIPPQPH